MDDTLELDDFIFAFDEEVLTTPLYSNEEESEDSVAYVSSETASTQAPTELEKTVELMEGGTYVPTKDVIDVATNADHEELDAILAKSLNQLSIQDRDRVIHEVHGITEAPLEDAEFVETKLKELEQCISKISEKAAYDRALYMSPDYVNDPKFRLMFLRGREFDPEEAAKAIVLHFEEKLKIWGMDLLVKEITMNDLQSGDMEALRAGFEQICPFRDRAGRGVVCLYPMLLEQFPEDVRVSTATKQHLTSLLSGALAGLLIN